MDRRGFIKKAGALAAGTMMAKAAHSNNAGKNQRPNIVMITCHDIGQHLGCYGVETVQTKHLDGLAEKGVRFSRFYSTSCVCSPGRGSLHTGRYPQSNGLMGLTHAPWWWSLNRTERHTASILKEAGYRTYLIGFIHVGDGRSLGYEHILSPRTKATETVEAAKNLINQATKGDQPFFAKVGFTEVHRAFTYGKDTRKGVFVPPYMQNTDRIREDLADFQAEIKFFDECVGEILKTLEHSSIAAETLVIMTSDHGIPYPGAKCTVRKAGMEVPFIIYQPGTVFEGGKVFNDLMSNIDVLPTLLDFLGVEIPENVQGLSFRSLIEGQTQKGPRQQVFGQYTSDMKRDNLSRCILTERYHLIRYFDQGRSVAYPVDVDTKEFAGHRQRCRTRGGARPFWQLFDLKDDPYELHDIGTEPANKQIVIDLSRRLLAWMKQVDDPLLEGPLRTPYYDKAIKDLLGV